MRLENIREVDLAAFIHSVTVCNFTTIVEYAERILMLFPPSALLYFDLHLEKSYSKKSLKCTTIPPIELGLL